MVSALYINNDDLERLVAFAQYKTLSATAQHLLISQPALSKSLHKLEDDLHVQLFKQYPNKLSLTDTGAFAAKKAARILANNLAYKKEVLKYEQQHHSLKVVVISPGLHKLIFETVKTATINKNSGSLSIKCIIADLLNGKADLVLSNHSINQQHIKSKYLGTERIFVNFPRSIDPGKINLSSITKENLPSIIVLDNMGVWEKIFQKYASQTTIIKQSDQDILNQIHRFSNIPFISSNIYSAINQTNFTSIPIEDNHFQIKIYANYREQKYEQLKNIITIIQHKFRNYICPHKDIS